jgi:hypothetical protein
VRELDRNGQEPGAGGRTPAAIPNWSVRGRYPGSRVLIRRLPKQIAQWLYGGPALAYRCGGSRGIAGRAGAPRSRLTRRRKTGGAPGTGCRMAKNHTARRIIAGKNQSQSPQDGGETGVTNNIQNSLLLLDVKPLFLLVCRDGPGTLRPRGTHRAIHHAVPEPAHGESGTAHAGGRPRSRAQPPQ